MEPFSNIELQLLKSSLDTKTNEEIAEQLDRPVEEVVQMINEITNGAAEFRSRDVAKYKEELALCKKRRRITPPVANTGVETKLVKPAKVPKVKPDRVLQDGAERRRKEDAVARTKNAQLTAASRNWQDRKKYATKAIDFTQMDLLRIDHKTQIYVPKTMTAREREKTVLQYRLKEQERLTKFKKAEYES